MVGLGVIAAVISWPLAALFCASAVANYSIAIGLAIAGSNCVLVPWTLVASSEEPAVNGVADMD